MAKKRKERTTGLEFLDTLMIGGLVLILLFALFSVQDRIIGEIKKSRKQARAKE